MSGVSLTDGISVSEFSVTLEEMRKNDLVQFGEKCRLEGGAIDVPGFIVSCLKYNYLMIFKLKTFL